MNLMFNRDGNLRWLRLLITLLFFLTLLVIPQKEVFAHAFLVKANPPPNSSLISAPNNITLTFNERLQQEQYSISVYDDNGHSVTQSPTTMSPDHRTLHMALPSLNPGIYTISYHIISADGHPVEHAYIMTIGNPAHQSGFDTESWQIKFDNTGNLQGGPGLWLDRFFYYITFLGFTGWMVWTRCYPIVTDEKQSALKIWRRNGMWLYFIMLLGLGICQWIASLSGKSGIWSITHTTFGWTWITSLLISLMGMFLFNRWIVTDFIMIAGLWLLEAFNGHAFAYSPQIITITADFIHLAAAAVWVGGLIYYGFTRKYQVEKSMQYLKRFSSVALYSMLILTVTGVVLTLYYLTDWRALYVTFWGILLLVKIALIVCVFTVASGIRQRLKSSSSEFTDADRIHSRIKMDFSLMLAIVFIVSILTVASPNETNVPLDWSSSKNNIEIHTVIEPDYPGVINSFQLHVKMRKQQPKQAILKLYYLGKPHIAPIQVPLKLNQQPVSVSDNRQKTNRIWNRVYSANGAYLTVPGKWKIEVRILNAQDDETVFDRIIRLYSTK